MDTEDDLRNLFSIPSSPAPLVTFNSLMAFWTLIGKILLNENELLQDKVSLKVPILDFAFLGFCLAQISQMPINC